MPARRDIKKILIIGSGPIVIGQACEFDYSGTQAAKVLKAHGYEVVLVNSNPATIMTDPELASTTYLEPLTWEYLAEIIERENPQALLPTLGGQTALNLAVRLDKEGVLAQHQVEVIGASMESIRKAEDRGLFRNAMEEISYPVPMAREVFSIREAREFVSESGFPLILRPAFTLGGAGGSIIWSREELEEKVERGIRESPIGQVLLEEALMGWKEFELEVMRDDRGNGVIVCSIENLDPMGVHTGDSITVAPAQTLTDKEYQLLRTMSLKIMNKIGVSTGGSNIQFAVHPSTGRAAVIEMNPRVSRSSALASKATGFPIAKIAALLAVGMTLDEIPNDITRVTPASFEPSIDYVVVKVPRFTFEKFPEISRTLATSMQSVGEVMAIGRTFLEALQKAFRSLEKGWNGLDSSLLKRWNTLSDQEGALRVPSPERLFYIKYAIVSGTGDETTLSQIQKISELTGIDSWFISQIARLVEYEKRGYEKRMKEKEIGSEEFRGLVLEGKKLGYLDKELAAVLYLPEEEVAFHRPPPSFLAVDTCAAEFPAVTPYFYSSYEESDDWTRLPGQSILILGSGPNRIGQGIEFDYCCVQAVSACRELGYEGIMVNSNPETVSTDYDVSSRLYFEPLVLEHVLEIYKKENPAGVVLQLGGQTPLKLAKGLSAAGVAILGTSLEAIDRTESRERFGELTSSLGLLAPPYGMASNVQEAAKVASSLGYPVILRPSYVLSGSAMRIIYDEEGLRSYFSWLDTLFEGDLSVRGGDGPILVDKFLEDAIELDVDCISDGKECILAGVMEHIEEAGVHSGDSACFLPPRSLSGNFMDQIKEDVTTIARELQVKGFMNVQFALRGNRLYILEVNPRASRTVPFVSKARGIPFVKAAMEIILGKPLSSLSYDFERGVPYWAVKIPVLPFKRLAGSEVILGPEMKSTGEVMGISHDPGIAFLKGLQAAGMDLPREGTVFLSVKDEDKRGIVPLARKLIKLGFSLIATEGTQAVLERSGIEAKVVRKVQEGSPHIVDLIREGEVSLAINTPSGPDRKKAGSLIRQAAVLHDVPLITTLSGATAAIMALESRISKSHRVMSLQEYHALPRPLSPVP